MNVSAIIVTYNPSLEELHRLMASIYLSCEKVILVDNGSKNETEILEKTKLFSNAEFFPLRENMGIGFAQNRGLERVFNQSQSDAVVLFDHDSCPDLEMINHLANAYQDLKSQGVKVGAVGPVFSDTRTNHLYPITVFKGFSLIKKYPAADNKPIEASVIIASGSFIPRNVFEDVGGMNEDYFIDYIDIDWSFRCTNLGYHIFCIPAARMSHQVGDERITVLGREISIHSPLRRYYLARNSIFMMQSPYINWRYKVREFFYSISRVVIFLMLVKKKLTYLRYILRGWSDGLMGKKGKLVF